MSEISCSIVIPAYNAADHILECLSSVVNHETRHAFEVVVVDDGSKDETCSLVSTHFPQVRLLQKKNGGPGSARNHGAEHALSSILVFIDADDVMLEGRLDHQVGYMLANPKVKLTFGNQQYERDPTCDFNREQGWASDDGYTIVEDAFQKLIIKGSSIANTSTAVWRSNYLEVGGQPEDVFVGEDYAMCCAIARQWPIAASCRYLTWYRQADHGNLMASAHTYVGPPRVLLENLVHHESDLLPETLMAAKQRLVGLVNMLIRHKWLNEGRSAALNALHPYQNFLPNGFARRWALITLVPPQIPRLIRWVKHKGTVTHNYQ